MRAFSQQLLAFAALLALVSPLYGLSRKYIRGPVPLSEEAVLHYSLDFPKEEISLAIEITSAALKGGSGPAWGGLGVSESTSGSMIGADIASVAFASGVLNNCTIKDRHVPFAAFPLGENKGSARGVYPNTDKCQNDGSWKLVACARDTDAGTMTIELQRALKAHDDQDRDITHGMQALIYAYGAGEIRYHGGKRGSTRITLFEKDGSLPSNTGDTPLPDDVISNQTVFATGYTIPSNKTTTYACTSFVLDIPPGGNLTMVAAEPLLDSGSDPNMVHHLVLYSCPKKPEFFNKTIDCDQDNSDMDCNGVVFAWAVGIKRWVLPDGVGLVLTEKDKYMSLNTHYDNPKLIKNTTDNSGVRLFFSKKRPTQAGSLILGDASVTLGGQIVKNNFKYQSTCPTECTEKYKKPINIFGSFLHMHTVGREMYTNRLSKNGTFLNTINKISYWSNDHQMLRMINPPLKVNPGDQLSTTCIYDTRKRPNTTFGLGTENEMCMEFIFYYPLQKFRPSEGNSARCGMFQLRNRNGTDGPPSTMCGSGSRGSLIKNLTNPTTNDTVGISNDFGNAPSVCTAAIASAGSTIGSNGKKNGMSSGGNSSTCFPASTLVVISSGVHKRMDEVELGDRVAVGDMAYSDVFAFTHREQDTWSEFVTLHTSHGTLSLTPPHFLYADGNLVPAGDVGVGAMLRRADGGTSRVTRVIREMMFGLYNPQTLHGDIVVDGFVASTYTKEVQPKAAHAMLAPLRFLARFSGVHLSAFKNGVSRSNFAWKVARQGLRVQ